MGPFSFSTTPVPGEAAELRYVNEGNNSLAPESDMTNGGHVPDEGGDRRTAAMGGFGELLWVEVGLVTIVFGCRISEGMLNATGKNVTVFYCSKFPPLP